MNLCSELDGEVILYAVWTPKSVKIDFNKVGGTGGTNYVNVTFGAKFSLCGFSSQNWLFIRGLFFRRGRTGQDVLGLQYAPG